MLIGAGMLAVFWWLNRAVARGRPMLGVGYWLAGATVLVLPSVLVSIWPDLWRLVTRG